MSKIFSGRFIFTVISALVFAWASFAKILTAEQIVSILMLIITFYFGRTDRQQNIAKEEIK